MRSRTALLTLVVVLAACGGGSGSSGTPAINNILPVEVNAGPANVLVNGLFTSVTICVPGTTTCQTIDGIQVDTGSVGLRLLKSAVTLPLASMTDSTGKRLGNCATYADMSYTWGAVAAADVTLAGEIASAVPIQLVGTSGFVAAPSVCSNGGTAADDVNSLGANGLLGIGLFLQDCGTACSVGGADAPPVYFSCSGSSCSVTSVPVAQQLQNPVPLFPQDNNGFLISLPSVPATGSLTVAGSLIFGIGTQSNNALSGTVYTTDNVGNFTTTFQNQIYSSSFIDSGSNGLFFLDKSTISLPACTDGDSDFSCPTQTVNYTATNSGSNGSSGSINFSVANADALFNTGNNAFSNLGGPDTGDFDWGLSFFYGRTTFIGIEGQASPGGTGPYWAY